MSMYSRYFKKLKSLDMEKSIKIYTKTFTYLFSKGQTLFRNKSANALALCHPPSASFCSVLAVQWSSRIFTHDRYNIPNDIPIEFEVNLGIIIEKYA